MSLILTTLPHYLILLVPLHCNGLLATAYPWLVGSTTTASALWHASQLWNSEIAGFLGLLDYGLTGLWTIADIILAVQTGDPVICIQIFYLNLAIYVLHQGRPDYLFWHSVWHLASAAKGIAIALLLQCISDQGRQEIGDMPYNSLVLDKDRVCQVE